MSTGRVVLVRHDVEERLLAALGLPDDAVPARDVRRRPQVPARDHADEAPLAVADDLAEEVGARIEPRDSPLLRAVVPPPAPYGPLVKP